MDLTIALLVLALSVLAAIGGHAWWTARRSAPRQPKAEPNDDSLRRSPAPEALGGGALGAVGDATERGPAARGVRHAPTFDDSSLGVGLTTLVDAGPGDRLTSSGGSFDFAARPGSAAEVDPPLLRQRGRLDALIDALVSLTLESPVSGELAVQQLPGSRRAGSKPMAIEGLNAEDGQWETPTHGQMYSEFQAGVQLANRAGPLNEIEYSEFVQKVEAFAEGVGALAELPDMLEVVARARELDTFAQPRDAQLLVVLRATAVAWSVGYVHQCAARHGFVPGALPGRLVVPGAAAGDPPVLVLSYDAQAVMSEDPQASAILELSLSLDVAQTPESAEPFPAWHQAATALAAEMDARIVDVDGQPVTLQLFDGIAKDLQGLYRELEARDLAAGSLAARRLFS